MQEPLVDKVGKEIEEGCFIVYGHALGRCAGLRIGKVTKVTYVPENNYTYKCDEKVPRITVRGVDDDWSHQEPKLTQKAGTLLFPNRIVVLPEHMVPDHIKKLLANV